MVSLAFCGQWRTGGVTYIARGEVTNVNLNGTRWVPLVPSVPSDSAGGVDVAVHAGLPETGTAAVAVDTDPGGGGVGGGIDLGAIGRLLHCGQHKRSRNAGDGAFGSLRDHTGPVLVVLNVSARGRGARGRLLGCVDGGSGGSAGRGASRATAIARGPVAAGSRTEAAGALSVAAGRSTGGPAAAGRTSRGALRAPSGARILVTTETSVAASEAAVLAFTGAEALGVALAVEERGAAHARLAGQLGRLVGRRCRGGDGGGGERADDGGGQLHDVWISRCVREEEEVRRRCDV